MVINFYFLMRIIETYNFISYNQSQKLQSQNTTDINCPKMKYQSEPTSYTKENSQQHCSFTLFNKKRKSQSISKRANKMSRKQFINEVKYSSQKAIKNSKVIIDGDQGSPFTEALRLSRKKINSYLKTQLQMESSSLSIKQIDQSEYQTFRMIKKSCGATRKTFPVKAQSF